MVGPELIHHGDCLETLKGMADNSVDSICTDPPYGIFFMAKKWDYNVPSIDVWRECLRVLKPGGHMLVACGTRTQHRMVVPIEDAGFEIRDVITWLYGSGFPKSLDVSKAIDASLLHGKARPEDLRRMRLGEGYTPTGRGRINYDIPGGNTLDGPPPDKHQPATDAAREWEGWGTALKPACEFWTLCRKPLSESTVAKNVLKWGTGGINVDGCRVGAGQDYYDKHASVVGCTPGNDGRNSYGDFNRAREDGSSPQGRFPANLILDEEAAQALNEQSGVLQSGSRRAGVRKGMGFHGANGDGGPAIECNSGGASRFFYCAKASKRDRGEGNGHPTVKPVALMAYLCRLITPPGGLVLDPFAGSGSTGVGALKEGFKFVGIEREAEYVEIATRRIAAS